MVYAEQTASHTTEIEQMVVWGNHSATQYPDISYASVGGVAVVDKVDRNWYEKIPSFLTYNNVARRLSKPEVHRVQHQQRSITCIAGRLAAAVHGVSMGVYSKGNSYGIDEDIIYSSPMICEDGEYKEVTGLEISEFSRERMSVTEAELLEEKSAVAGLI